jgi:tetratricopeptide (TPR) repeat protein
MCEQASSTPDNPTPTAGIEGHARDVIRQRQLAEYHASQGEFGKAIACWQQVERLEPLADDAPQMIAALTLKHARQKPTAGGSGNGSEGDGPAQRETDAVAGPTLERRQVVFSRRQELEQAIRNNPEDEQNYLELAELHLAAGRTYDAQRTLSKAFDVKADPRVLERLEDVNVLRAQELVDLAQQRAAEENTSKALEALQERRVELEQLTLDVTRARCERYPYHGQLRFQLGMQLKRRGELKPALDHLQGALADPRCRASASLAIGEILQQYKQFPKSLQCYRQAAQLAACDGDQTDTRRRALYRAGVLATEMQLFDSARAYFSELVRIDPAYKDAATRLDKLAEIGDNL